ncbi:aldehyde dehydrogenase family protein [Glycomyces sp. A-F 0318]|uniref:aldehyde dehydrogenase family protein n=1 Tax=Glycomyces amatae TaxID=2881355 RepID=UPI001E2CB4B5|nr:aldehyde dehydrogenase family protein [Glycomyces amatae]MCD0444450.1 aldehyde dehydrogenase family protein [Glycomyces amatae]
MASANDPQPVSETVARLRAHFATGRTKPLPWRLEQLKGLDRMLREAGDELADALRADLGKAAPESFLAEIDFVAAEVRALRKHLRSWLRPKRVHTPPHLQPAKAYTLREPLGVVTVIGPFNYPVQLLLAPLAGALACGNAVVVKPSEAAGATAAALGRLIARYLDPDAVAVVQGGPDETAALLAERVDHVFFTGSARVGRIVAKAAAEHLTPVTLELGGKSPAIVEPGADLAAAARRIAWGKFMNAGQTCIAPDYVLAVDGTGPELERHLAEAVREMYGHAPAESPDFGRIIDERAFDRIARFLGEGRLVCGGGHNREERYIAPTVLADVSPKDAVMGEEVFGPVLPILAADSLDEAIAFVNAGEKPLALYAFTASEASRRKLLTRTSSGAVGFNVPMAHIDVPGLPFGGVGGSGLGSYHGKASIEAFSHLKSVLDKPLAPDTMRVVYPPFTAIKEQVLRRLR